MADSVLITGITGFVGPHLAKSLIKSNLEVYAFCRPRGDSLIPKRLSETGLNGDIRILEGDINDLSSIMSALDKSQPKTIFHLAAQSYVPRSFSNPIETIQTNSMGTANLLEAIRLKDVKTRIIFAGSSEAYGLQIASKEHYSSIINKKSIIPDPIRIPELPIDENNFFRPMSPYGISKTFGDYLFRNYHDAYGLDTIVSRAFNHEGQGRGKDFVTSTIVRQCISLKLGENDKILIGDPNVFRDWSHVDDIVNGYRILATKGKSGEVYVQGSKRTNSVLSLILFTLEEIGFEVQSICTLNGEKRVQNPLETNLEGFYGTKFETTTIDNLMLNGELNYTLSDKGVLVNTPQRDIKIVFDTARFRKSDVPILMSNPSKIEKIGFKITKTLKDIIKDMTNYYYPSERRTC